VARQALDAGRLEAAQAAARRAIAANPRELDAHLVLAAACERLGQLPEAIGAWMEAFTLEPARVSSALGLALAMARHGQPSQAAELLAMALTLHPDEADLHTTRGNLLRALGRFDEAEACHRRALALAPHSPAIYANLSSLYLASRRPADALAAAERAVSLAEGSPELRFNLGTCLLQLGRAGEAADVLEALVAAAPSHHQGWLNLGEARLAQGDVAGAEAAFRSAIAAAPEAPDAHFNLALRLLERGALEEGWREYEWRRRIAEIPLRRLPGALWDGGPMPGKVLLVTAEQGLGDTFQFARFLEPARERSRARLVFECPPALLGVLDGVEGVDELVAAGGALPLFDAHTSLLSLPGLTPRGGDGVSISGPYLHAEPARVARWRARLAPAALNVAIAWQGNPAYRADGRRSPPLAAFAPLARVPGVKLVSVQKHHGREQLAAWPHGLELFDLGPELDEAAPFVDTAAVLAAVDLVISSDTAVPHLAGALGQEVWLALPRPADWRWGQAPTSTDWYPRFRLFRQREAGEWGEVFARLEAELRARVSPLLGAPQGLT